MSCTVIGHTVLSDVLTYTGVRGVVYSHRAYSPMRGAVLTQAMLLPGTTLSYYGSDSRTGTRLLCDVRYFNTECCCLPTRLPRRYPVLVSHILYFSQRASYTPLSTDIYCFLRASPSTDIGTSLHACYAMSGTDIA
eukprot:1692597-Rhodomonas_salina.1